MTIYNSTFTTKHVDAFIRFPSLCQKAGKNKVRVKPFLEKRVLQVIEKYEQALSWWDETNDSFVRVGKEIENLQATINAIRNKQPGEWPELPYPSWKGMQHNSYRPPFEGWDKNHTTYIADGAVAAALEDLQIVRIVGYWHWPDSGRMYSVEFQLADPGKNYKVVDQYLQILDEIKKKQPVLGGLVSTRNAAQCDIDRFREILKQFE